MRKIFNIGCGGLLLMAVATLITAAAFGLNPGYTSSTAYSQRIPLRTEACAMAQEFVLQNLKAPSTAKFPSGTQDCRARHDGDTWIVLGYVDSQNGFGAMIRSDYGVEMNYKPSTSDWYLVEIGIVSR